MSKFVLSKHAKSRIRERGINRRTYLSENSVLEEISKEDSLLINEDVFLFSETDGTTLFLPTVSIGKGSRLIKTVFPAKQKHIWPTFLAKFRKVGRTLLTYSESIPKLISKNGVAIGLVYFDFEAGERKPITPMFSWFVEKRDYARLLEDYMFYHSILEFLEDWHGSDYSVSINMNSVDVFVGYRVDEGIYTMWLPLSVLYEVSGKKPPFDLEDRL